LIGEINLAGPAEVDAAVFAARKAYESRPWSKFNGAKRVALIHKLADLIEANGAGITKAEISAMGQSAAILGSVMISIVAACWRYYGSIEAKAYLM
jgi:acyl-CoA reductase-like NAD-dependent aldehyde dehydrogenase